MNMLLKEMNFNLLRRLRRYAKLINVRAGEGGAALLVNNKELAPRSSPSLRRKYAHKADHYRSSQWDTCHGE